MARGIGVPLKIDSLTFLGEFGHYDRVLTDFDLANHLLETILLDMDGFCISISLFYENVLDFVQFVIVLDMIFLCIA